MRKIIGVAAILVGGLITINGAPRITANRPCIQAAQLDLAPYYVAFLRRGPQWTPQVTPETTRIQAEHLANIKKLAEAGALVAAGPFLDDGELRGIFIFKVDSLDQAKSLTQSDPAVKAGRLALEIRRWLGPKGIGERYAAEKKKNPEAPDQMGTYQLALFKKSPKAGNAPPSQSAIGEHLANIKKLEDTGKLRAAGPFADQGELGGMFVFETGSLEEARLLAESDPLVKAGVLGVELHPWMSAKGVLP
ncbi:MAG TPA: YciI family protein [Blastocatellia bacterium]|nr:YciI family protein [Blastocatellia bacterium]